jgi:hypothetical protein
MGRKPYATTRACLLLVALTMLLGTLAPAQGAVTPHAGFTSSAPTIGGDKDDFAPGEAVTLSGENWQPGEPVHIFVNDDKGESWSRNVDVAAAVEGTIEDRFNLPDWFVARYSVTATGLLSGTATTSFTDGNVKIVSAAGRHFDYQATSYS